MFLARYLCMLLPTAVVAVACTTEPRVRRLPLLPGDYALSASTLVSSTAIACAGSDRYLGVAIQSLVTLSLEGNEWVARSRSSADGDVEIRFAETGSRFGSITVSGTATGTAIDRRAEETFGLATLSFTDESG